MSNFVNKDSGPDIICCVDVPILANPIHGVVSSYAFLSKLFSASSNY